MSSIIKSKSYKISLTFIVILIVASHILWLINSGISSGNAAIFGMITGICFTISFLLIGNNLSYYRPQSFSFGFLLGWVLLFASFCIFIPKTLIGFFNQQKEQFHAILTSHLYIHYAFDFLILACYSAICLIWYHHFDILETDLRKQEAADLNREAELFKLRQQLQPHFLFNSLNSINALIGSKPAEARKMVNQLSDFLRYTIKKQENELVALEDEIGNLELYLEIEKLRFGHRLHTIFDIEQKAKSQKLPALLLQPILENAIKFGLYDTLEVVEIKISAKSDQDKLEISVENPFDPNTSSHTNGTGFGLASVRKRLQLIYFRNDLLTVDKTGNVFKTTILIPQNRTDSNIIN